MSENDALIRRWFEEVWNQGRVATIDELLAADCTAHGLSEDPANPLRGPAAFRAFHASFRAAFPDIEVVVEDTVSEGDKVVARCSVRGKHTGQLAALGPTQAPMEITGMVIARIRDGQFVEVWNNFDFMTMYKQLGAI